MNEAQTRQNKIDPKLRDAAHRGSVPLCPDPMINAIINFLPKLFGS